MVYASLLKILAPIGVHIIKSSEYPLEKHKEVLKKIKFRSGANSEKIELLKKSYKPLKIRKYIISFSENIDNIGDEEFDRYYAKYCDYKHSNMLASTTNAGDINDGEIDWFLDLILGIIVYLEKSPELKPFKI